MGQITEIMMPLKRALCINPYFNISNITYLLPMVVVNQPDLLSVDLPNHLMDIQGGTHAVAIQPLIPHTGDAIYPFGNGSNVMGD